MNYLHEQETIVNRGLRTKGPHGHLARLEIIYKSKSFKSFHPVTLRRVPDSLMEVRSEEKDNSDEPV